MLLKSFPTARRIAIRGPVRSADVKRQIGRDFLVLTIDIGRGRLITARVLNFPRNEVSLLNGATVKARGVYGSVFNTRRQFIGPQLFVNSLGIDIERGAPPSPFSGPVTPLSELLRFEGARAFSGRAKLHSVVTYLNPGSSFYLQDGFQGLLVRTEQQPRPAVGTGVEVVGLSRDRHLLPNSSERCLSCWPATIMDLTRCL